MTRDQQKSIRQWLQSLGLLTAISLDTNEANARLAIFIPMLASRFPEVAFTPASLEHVAAQCARGFPTYAEIVGYLTTWWRDERPIIAIQAPREPDPHEPSDDERAAVTAHAAQCRAILADVSKKLRAPDATPRPLHRYLTPEQLDRVNPLPNGTKRTLRAVA